MELIFNIFYVRNERRSYKLEWIKFLDECDNKCIEGELVSARAFKELEKYRAKYNQYKSSILFSDQEGRMEFILKWS